MRLWSAASIFAVRLFDHSSASDLLRNVLITTECKQIADRCQLFVDSENYGSIAPPIKFNDDLARVGGDLAADSDGNDGAIISDPPVFPTQRALLSARYFSLLSTIFVD
jgi:hypothetical protein